MAKVDKGETQARGLALAVLDQATVTQKSALLLWAEAMMQIRNSDLSTLEKVKRSIAITSNSETIFPLVKVAGAELKRIGWSERNLPARLGIAAGLAALTLSGSGAGIAALGTAVGLPLWVVFAAGGTFAGTIIEEATRMTNNNSDDA